EIDAGTNLVNTASVTDAQHDTGTSSVTAIVDQHPGLTIGKIESTSHVDHAGQGIEDKTTERKTGNKHLTGLTVADGFVTLSGGGASLAVGASEVPHPTRRSSDLEIDAGTNLVNTASVTDAQHDTGTSSVTAIVDQHPGLTIGKIESTSHVDHAGQ